MKLFEINERFSEPHEIVTSSNTTMHVMQSMNGPTTIQMMKYDYNDSN